MCLSLTHLSSLSLLATDAHTHETDVEASKALAPDFVEFMEPRRYELREQEAGGDLVRELEEVPAEDLEAGEVYATLPFMLLFVCVGFTSTLPCAFFRVSPPDDVASRL